jgi:transposase InsO family protein
MYGFVPEESDLFILRGVPGHISSDNGLEFVAKGVQDWITAVVREPPTSRRAVLERTATSKASIRACATNSSKARPSYTLREAQIVIESWRRYYNGVRPHASLGYRSRHRRCLCQASPRGAETSPKLTLPPDHSVEADQRGHYHNLAEELTIASSRSHTR